MVAAGVQGSRSTGPGLVELLATTSRQVARGVAGALGEDGGTLEGYRVLRALAVSPGTTMGQVASALQLPAPTATRVVDGLVDGALVYRRPDPDDGRRVLVHLSTAGRARLSRWESLVRAHEDAVTAVLGPAQVQVLVAALGRAAVGLAEPAQPPPVADTDRS